MYDILVIKRCLEDSLLKFVVSIYQPVWRVLRDKISLTMFRIINTAGWRRRPVVRLVEFIFRGLASIGTLAHNMTFVSQTQRTFNINK